jgi:hypothetical protein
MSGPVDFVGLSEPQGASVAGVTLAPCVGCVAALRPASVRRRPVAWARRDVLGGDQVQLMRSERGPGIQRMVQSPPCPSLHCSTEFSGGWPLKRFDQTGQCGDPGQRYLAIYEFDSVGAFNAALQGTFAASHPCEEWET